MAREEPAKAIEEFPISLPPLLGTLPGLWWRRRRQRAWPSTNRLRASEGMSRIVILLVGVVGYTVFLATFLYLIGFVSGLVTPTSLDQGGLPSEFWPALAINLGFVLLFGVQHCIMARPWFKWRWTKIVPAPIERTVFMMFTCAILGLMFWQWRSMPEVLWAFDGVVWVALHAVAFVGWGIVLLSTFLIDHFDLFGLRQTWLAFRGKPYTQKPFAERSLYRRMRHPLMFGFMVTFWVAPVMTVGHLVFAGAFTLFVSIALLFEENDLVTLHGASYRDYQRRVPKLLPRFGSGDARGVVAADAR